jgi:hypothetical protein
MRFVSLILACAALAVALPSPALASGDDVINDCAQDGVVDGHYSDRELRQAESDLPSDLDEYTDCREAIRSAMGGGSGGKGGHGRSGGGSGGATDPSLVTASGVAASSKEDLDALEHELDRSGGAPSLRVGGKDVTPGDPSGGKLLGVATTANDLPAPVLAALLAVLAMAGAGTVVLARRGLPAPLAARAGRIRDLAAPAARGIRRVPRIFRR